MSTLEARGRGAPRQRADEAGVDALPEGARGVERARPEETHVSCVPARPPPPVPPPPPPPPALPPPPHCCPPTCRARRAAARAHAGRQQPGAEGGRRAGAGARRGARRAAEADGGTGRARAGGPPVRVGEAKVCKGEGESEGAGECAGLGGEGAEQAHRRRWSPALQTEPARLVRVRLGSGSGSGLGQVGLG